MCLKAVCCVKMLSREVVPTAESVSLPLVACSTTQVAVAFSTLCVSAEGF